MKEKERKSSVSDESESEFESPRRKKKYSKELTRDPTYYPKYDKK